MLPNGVCESQNRRNNWASESSNWVPNHGCTAMGDCMILTLWRKRDFVNNLIIGCTYFSYHSSWPDFSCRAHRRFDGSQVLLQYSCMQLSLRCSQDLLLTPTEICGFPFVPWPPCSSDPHEMWGSDPLLPFLLFKPQNLTAIVSI